MLTFFGIIVSSADAENLILGSGPKMDVALTEGAPVHDFLGTHHRFEQVGSEGFPARAMTRPMAASTCGASRPRGNWRKISLKKVKKVSCRWAESLPDRRT